MIPDSPQLPTPPAPEADSLDLVKSRARWRAAFFSMTAAAVALSAAVGVLLLTPTPKAGGPHAAASPTTSSPTPEADEESATEPADVATEEPTPAAETCVGKKYEAATDRDVKKLERTADDKLGTCLVIYGEITQFDSATGKTSFRANVCGSKRYPEYGFLSDCDTNAMFDIDPAAEKAAAELVNGDVVEMRVSVAGTLTYETTIGGSMTVPKFTAYKLHKYATTK
ncbi:hypothetical protein AB0D04_38745 [Streptomyces sp. NPDC048483]|uniref:hypothetical protein n=1 Tax=Streptomyces sp. NPDC048483 TaxID=3154927 RepID=UPI003437480F